MAENLNFTDRVLPHSKEAEQSVLGSMLSSPQAVGAACEILKPDDFFFGQNKEVYAAILELFNENDTNISPSCHLSTLSTSNHTTRVDSVKSKGFEALRAVRQLPPHANKSINHIFSDESNYYKDGDEHDDGLNVVYCMETL